MKVPRFAIALLALGASLYPLAGANALSVPQATQLTLPKPNLGLNQGYLPFQSCSSIGNCAVAGIYLTSHGFAAGSLDYEVKGVWQAPLAVTPPAGYSRTKGVTMEGLACPSNGTCVALGQYATSSNQLPFIESEVNGTWHKGVALALPKNAMATSESATPRSITCVSVGNCTVVGTYTTDSITFATEGFILSEMNGVWRNALELSLPVGINTNPLVTLSQVTCWSPANCVAVGSYVDANNISHAVAVPEIAGVWKRALPLGLPGNTSAFAGAQFNEIACTTSGSCLAAGTYNTSTGAVQPLVALSIAGAWNRALEVSLPNGAGNPEALIYGFKGVACSSAGNCVLGGQYLDKNGRYQGFLDNVVNGNLQRAHVLALPAGAVQAGHNGGVVSVSCPGVGTCVAGAAYLSAAKKYEALVVSETNNVWSPGTKISLPGSAASVGVAGGIYSVQCFTTSTCQVTGSYQSGSSRYDGFSLVTAP
jgi:hypothetical protein